jgi:hypothetical protein
MPSSEPPSRDTNPRQGDPRRRDDTSDDRPAHEDPNYERDQQLWNVAETGVNLASEVAQDLLRFSNLGKVAGPAATLVTASSATTEGVPLAAKYHDNKWDTIAEQSGDTFGDRSGSNDSDPRGAADTSAPEPTGRPPIEHTEESQRVLDDIEFRVQAREAKARDRAQGYGRW